VGREAAHIENNGAVGVFLCRCPDDLGMQSGHAPLVRRDDPAFYGIALNEMREGERSEGDRDNEIGMTPLAYTVVQACTVAAQAGRLSTKQSIPASYVRSNGADAH
jgi:hypothetical protein